MQESDRISEIIQHFAAAALDPAAWLTAMSKMSDEVGAVCCALELADLDQGVAVMHTSIKLDGDVLDHYQERIFHINPRVKRAMSMPVGYVADDRQLLSDDDPGTPEFLDWLKGAPYRFIQGGKVLEQGSQLGFFSSNYASNHGLPDERQSTVHARVFPHLINSIALGKMLSGGFSRVLNFTDAIGASTALAVLGSAGNVIECSAGFQALLGSDHLLDIRRRRLVANDAANRPHLAAFLKAALCDGRFTVPPHPLRLTSATARNGLVLRAIPLPPEGTIFDVFRPNLLVVVTDLDKPFTVRRHDLVTLYGLTEREADVAALIGEGLAAAQVAAALGLSTFTVREHVQKVFAKMDVTRQAELVALVQRLGTAWA